MFRRSRSNSKRRQLNTGRRKLTTEALEDRRMLACVLGDIRVGLYDSLGAGAAGLAANAGVDLDDAAGYCVDIIPKANWLTMTVPQFQQYDVLWIGADRFSGAAATDFDEAVASRPVWEAAIDPAEVMIAGGDYDFHYAGNQANAIAVTEAMVAEVADSATSRPGLVLQAGGYAQPGRGAPWFQLLGGSFTGLGHGTTAGDPAVAGDIYSGHQFNINNGFGVADYTFSLSCHGAVTMTPASPVVTTYNLQPLFKVNDQDCFLLSDPNFPPNADGSVHGTKFEDLNGNGVQDEGERGLAGWEFYVDINGNGVFDPGEPSAISMSDDPTTEDDDTGMYWLEGIPEGEWEVREVRQPGWAQTAPLDSYTITIGNHKVDYTFTTDGDFDQGAYQQLNHDAPNGDQLQIDEGLGAPEPIIWISNSQDGTISKFDTQTGDELGRYRTGSEHYVASGLSPSRVAVMNTGDVWVANRVYPNPAFTPIPTPNAPTGNVVKVLHDRFIDRNGNGVMDTSTDSNNNGTIDPSEVMAWDANNDGFPDDERIEFVVHAGRDNLDNPVLYNGGARGMAIDAQGRLWVGLRDLNQYEVFDANDGSYVAQVATNNGPYGSVIDKRGILWSSSYPSTMVDRIDTNTLASLPSVDFLHNVYGITVDRDGIVWASTWVTGPRIKRYDPVTSTLTDFLHPAIPNTFSAGGLGGGITVDHNGAVWAASKNADSMLKYVFDSGGALDAGQSVAVAVGANPKAAAVDSDGFVWTTSLNMHTATKIDPTLNTVVGVYNTGLLPYNYSDMTGDVRANATIPEGSWNVVQDSHVAGMVWNNINWNNEPEASVPAGTQIIVEARAAESLLLLSGQPFVAVANNANPGVIGRFVEVRVTLRGFHDEECVRIQPILSDINIRGDVDTLRFEGMDFGNARASSVHGFKWLDVDRDGVQDADERGLAGVEIYADLNGNGVYDVGEPITVTMADDPATEEDETGMWWLEGLPPGEYTIGEIIPAAPFAGYADGLEQTFPGGSGFHHIFLEPGSRVDGLIFGNGPKPPTGGIGNSPPGSIHGTKWFDDNGNGVRDPGEPGVPGVTIFVDYNGNGIRDEGEPFAVTMRDDPATDEDESGMYWLEGVVPGEWSVYEELPDGWVQTFPSSSTVSASGFDFIRIGNVDGFGYADGAGLKNANGTDANVDGIGVLATGDSLPDLNLSGNLAAADGDDFDHRTAAEVAGSALQGSGYTDLGSDGSQFTDISLSTSYDTTFPGGNFPAPPSSEFPNQPGFQFDFFVAHGDITAGMDLYLNVVFGDFDRGDAQLRVASGVKTLDVSLNDLILGPDENGGIRSAFVVLPFYDIFQPVLGGYEAHVDVDFLALDEPYTAFDYVEISKNPIVLSDSPTPHVVKVIGRQHTEGVDFGNTRPCSAHGIKWEDLNGNGARDPGEVGLPGVTIFWDKNNNGELDAGELATRTMDDDPTTPEDETGHWWMMGVTAGTHVFRELLPDGSVSTTGAVTLTIDPDCNDIKIDVPRPGDVTGEEDNPIIIDVVGSDLGTTPLTPEIGQGPANGSVEVLVDGTIVFTPDPDFTGTDVFSYQLAGPGVSSNDVVVQINVTPVNDVPRLNEELEDLVTEPGVPVTVDIVGASHDPEGDPISVVLAPSSSTLPPFNGSVTNNDDGTVTYTPNENFVGVDNFAFILTDGDGASELIEVSVEVLGSAPVLGDFNANGIVECDDVTPISNAIANGSSDLTYDMNADSAVDTADLHEWLAIAAEAQGLSQPYLHGDVNLDGNVDSIDVGTLLNFFETVDQPEWKRGNVNGDCIIDSADLGVVLNDFGRSITSTAAGSASASIDSTALGIWLNSLNSKPSESASDLRDLAFESYDQDEDDKVESRVPLLTSTS